MEVDRIEEIKEEAAQFFSKRELKKIKETIESIREEARKNGGTIYVRYTDTPKREEDESFYSMNHNSNQSEAGLSVLDIGEEDSDVSICSALTSYYVLNYFRGDTIYPFLFSGEEVGRGSDDEPLIINRTLLGSIDLEVINMMLRGYKIYIKLMNSIEGYEDVERRLKGNENDFGLLTAKKIFKENCEDYLKEFKKVYERTKNVYSPKDISKVRRMRLRKF